MQDFTHLPTTTFIAFRKSWWYPLQLYLANKLSVSQQKKKDIWTHWIYKIWKCSFVANLFANWCSNMLINEWIILVRATIIIRYDYLAYTENIVSTKYCFCIDSLYKYRFKHSIVKRILQINIYSILTWKSHKIIVYL